VKAAHPLTFPSSPVRVKIGSPDLQKEGVGAPDSTQGTSACAALSHLSMLSVSMLWKPELASNPLLSYWMYPHDKTFKAPFQAQRVILMEALRRAPASDVTMQCLLVLERICRRFGIFALQLQQRYGARPGVRIADEYDVQDHVHAVLRLLFEDVRPEEHTPSRAGAASRIDFLLKVEQVVVETKMTRNGLGAKEVGAELTIDLARYRSHPDCKGFVALVYHPERRIGNPKGLEADLSGASSGIQVIVVVCQD
jgi:REase_DpnII-MboI